MKKSSLTDLHEELSASISRLRESLNLPDGILRILVAVSGGEDSQALLNVLAEISEKERLRLIVGHVDHRLRPGSGVDGEFVKEAATALGIPCFSIPAETRPPGANLESWAREARYGILEQLRRDRKAHVVATAHHMSDQAETVLFRVVTGRLATSAHSMAEYDAARKVWRPFLSVPKEAVSEHCATRRIPFVMDPTNNDRARTRNRIRHELLPELTTYNPAIIENLAVLGSRLNDDEALLKEEAREIAWEKSEWTVAALQDLPNALRWRVVRAIAEKQVGSRASRIGYRAYGVLVLWLLENGSQETKYSELGHGVSCELAGLGRFSFNLYSEQVEIASEIEQLIVPGVVQRSYGDGSRAYVRAAIISADQLSSTEVLEIIREKAGDPMRAARAFFDAGQIDTSQLYVRERRDGDRLRVWKRGERKLKKLLQEQGLTLTLRDRLPIVENGGDILWVPGIARSESAPVSDTSKEFLELTYFRG